MIISSGQSELDQSVLNKNWVSVPMGSEHFSFHTKNQYEEALFKTEDERYEHDIYILSSRTLTKELKQIYEEIQARKLSQFQAFKEYRHLIKPWQLGWILHMYDTEEKKTSIKDYLNQDLEKALYMIINLCIQNLQDAELKQASKVKTWKKTQQQNFSKSLDYRSFHFKQNEKKYLTNKNLIKDL
jgi:paired amphipathic helix protein Sin3a